jgi:dienelactone hydrolase
MTMHTIGFGILASILANPSIMAQGQAGGPVETSPQASPRLPGPSGPFGIGRVGYHWIDTTRPDRFSSDPQAHRELMVYLWYPTSQKSANDKGSYFPDAKQMDAVPEVQRRMRDDYGVNWPLIASGAIHSHAVDNAVAAKRPLKFPVIVLSHGLGGSGFGYTSLIEDLVSHGYVVAAIEHTYTAGAVVFPNGRIVLEHHDTVPPGLTAEERFKRMAESAGAGITEGAADVRFTLGKLAGLNNGQADGSPLTGRLDLGNVAAMGHSVGAEFAARACQLDARFKACVDLDGGMVPVSALPEYSDGATMKQPLLFLEAYHAGSKMFGTQEQLAAYFNKKEEQFKTCCPPGSFAVELRSAGMMHGSFSDDPLLEAGDRPSESAIALHNLDLIETFIRTFLDRTLQGGEAPLLTGSSAQPSEATIQKIGHW